MGKFSANISALDQAVSDLNSAIDELESIIVTYNVLHTDLNKYWDGAASEAFLDGLMNNREKMRESFRALLSYRSAIKSLAQKLRDMDEREERFIRLFDNLGTLGAYSQSRKSSNSGGTVHSGSGWGPNGAIK